MSDKKGRVAATLLYLAFLAGIQFYIVGNGFPINEKLLWFANGAAGLLLGSRLLNPHFVPPADVATNSFVAGGTLVAALAAEPPQQTELALIWISIAACTACFMLSVFVLMARRTQGLETRLWVLGIERGVKAFGAPRTIFTLVILALAWVFHRGSTVELFSILAAWTLIVALDPIEALFHYFGWLFENRERKTPDVLGTVAAHQAPGLVLIRQNDEIRYKPGTLMAL
ncbi:hypothetical protein [Rhodophyticola porphyridii]|uniref:hypothetical protein n=1 Tax=Rhodophyticola porphyridii TaxID=1852017 RepID=UPI0035CF0D22